MATQIHPYLNFKGNCKEAMTFYQACIGGTLSLITVGESEVAGHVPAAMHDRILHASLLREGEVMLLASDGMGQEIKEGNSIVLSLNCSSEEETKTFFSGLSGGGQITHPLKVEFWGALFGGLIDKFGITWVLNYDIPKA